MKPRRVKKLDPDRPFAENAARMVRVRLGELRAYVPRVLEADAIADQHDMRIAAKRLRYVLEVTEICFGNPATIARARARDLQGLLGEMRDCDVMLPRVHGQLEKLRENDAQALRRRAAKDPDLDPGLARTLPNRTAYRGLEVLAVYLEARRRHLFDRFRAFWAEQEKAGTWDSLEQATEKQLALAKERRRAEREANRTREELERAAEAEREARERAAEAQAQLERMRPARNQAPSTRP